MIGRLDHALEELRHATFGFYGSAPRASLLQQVSWEWSPVHYRLLRTVEATEPMRPTVTELALVLLTDKARASRLVDQVQGAGLVERRVGRLDRRRREVELREAGRAVLADARRVRLDSLRTVLGDWPEPDLTELVDLLDRFNSSVRDASEWLSGATNSSDRRRP